MNMKKYDLSQFHIQALMLLVPSDSPKCGLLASCSACNLVSDQESKLKKSNSKKGRAAVWLDGTASLSRTWTLHFSKCSMLKVGESQARGRVWCNGYNGSLAISSNFQRKTLFVANFFCWVVQGSNISELSNAWVAENAARRSWQLLICNKTHEVRSICWAVAAVGVDTRAFFNRVWGSLACLHSPSHI